MVDAAAKSYFLSRPEQSARGQWADLYEELNGFADRRNDFAHGSVELLFDAEKRIGFYLMPGLYVSRKYPTGEPPRYAFTAEQVEQLASQFGDLASAIQHYRVALQAKRRSSLRKPV
jgi:hypothetical protein